jgi:hypothetical protein
MDRNFLGDFPQRRTLCRIEVAFRAVTEQHQYGSKLAVRLTQGTRHQLVVTNALPRRFRIGDYQRFVSLMHKSGDRLAHGFHDLTQFSLNLPPVGATLHHCELLLGDHEGAECTTASVDGSGYRAP